MSPSKDDDIFNSSSSRLLSPPSSAPRKSPSRQSISLSGRRSPASLRAASGSLAHDLDEDGHHNLSVGHSLAHELAVALMPEPTAGSKLLAEEFGIEYDEGAEGIDGEIQSIERIPSIQSFADELSSHSLDTSFQDGPPSSSDDLSPNEDLIFASPATRRQRKPPEQDVMEVFAQDLASTDKFLTHLRRLDIDPGSSIAPLERIASDVIRRINDTARNREGQVRELLEYEREFRKISGEVGGNDVLGQLEELANTEDLLEQSPSTDIPRPEPLDAVTEEPSTNTSTLANEWEVDPDRTRLGDDDEDFESPSPSPVKDAFPPPPPITGPMTPANTIPQLAYLRTSTASLVSSLATISEQAQVNGAATTEAGRKIRALKNKLGGWRTDWDGAERSRLRIEKWEAGLEDGDVLGGLPSTLRGSRLDGRKLVAEQLRAFERALVEAGVKTQAIMAAS